MRLYIIFMWHRVCLNIIVTSVLILDDKLTSRVSDGANADYVDGPTSYFVTESGSSVRQDERSQAIAPQQEDNRRSGGSRDSAGGNKGSNRARFIILGLVCALMKINTVANIVLSNSENYSNPKNYQFTRS
jgi:hypothetical protein